MVFHKEPEQPVMPIDSSTGLQMPNTLSNALEPNAEMKFSVFLSYKPHGPFFNNHHHLSETPLWTQENLHYNHAEENLRSENFTLPVD